jgi:hypothetical protein
VELRSGRILHYLVARSDPRLPGSSRWRLSPDRIVDQQPGRVFTALRGLDDLPVARASVRQQLLRNALDRISTNARIAYKDSCVLYDVEEGLRNLENAPPVLSKDALLSTEDPLLATVAELRAVEAESIQTAIKALEDEARALENKKKKLQQQIKEELTAANDIHSMLASAAVQGK